MKASAERWLLTLVPFAAMFAVALGLRLGAGDRLRAAIVFAAPSAGPGMGLAWQVVALEDERGARSPLARIELDVTSENDTAMRPDPSATTVGRWHGTTNDDGIAEVHLTSSAIEGLRIEVRSRGERLASGLVKNFVPHEASRVLTAWMPFARRQGSIDLDVAVPGGRAAPGFAGSVWVRATDASTTARMGGVTITPESDPSMVSTTTESQTDAQGWAELTVTPVGLAVSLRLHAFVADGRKGDWEGGLFMSPGAADLETRARWNPTETPEFRLTLPTAHTRAYLEIDNTRGRAWATTVDASIASPDALPSARVVAPALPTGQYWAIAANDPEGAALLGPGTMARPFSVAASDDAARRLADNASECEAVIDPRAAERRLASCLAVAHGTSAPRWVALDGFAQERDRAGEKRARGLALALGAVLVAIVLETALLLRAAVAARARLRAMTDQGEGVPTTSSAFKVAVALLIALLGLLLLAAFLARAA